MDTITHLQPLLNHTFKGHPGLLNNPFVRQQHVSTRAWNMVNFSDQKSVDIKLGTAEGDKITLSLNTILEESYSSYNSRGYMDGIVTQSQMKAFSRLSGRELSITVEGDLNDEELSDIKNVLEKIENLAGDFFAGEMDEAVQQAIQFDDMGSVIA
ncbi:MAG: hypothetical protein SVW57_15035, partial [Thermodesulfobacteriota bacterium]|nr:hypothetical protein [Thermodesulfobacteriota bacterium]